VAVEGGWQGGDHRGRDARGIRRPWGLALLAILATAAPSPAATLDLGGCVELAIARNPQMLDAIDAETAARIRLDVAELEYELQVTPTIDGGLQGSNTTNQNFELLLRRKFLATGTQVDLKGTSRVFSTVPQVSVPYFSEARITVAQPLFQGWTSIENRDGLDDAERRIQASRHAIEVTREDTVFEVVRSYYDVVRADQLLRVARESLERVRALKTAAEGRLELGKVSKMDVYRTELQEARVRNTLADQEARRAAALDELKLLVGLDPRIEFEIEKRLQGPSLRDLSGTDFETTAERRRAEVREARAEVEDAQRKLVLARYGMWPSVELVGSYAQQGTGESFGDSFDLDRSEWNVGLRSSVPLDRTIQKANLSEAELTLRGRERRLGQIRSRVIGQVRQALRRFDRTRAEADLAARVAEQAAQQEELARYRYEKGLGNNFDLVQAEEQLTEARAARVLVSIDEALAAAAVRRAAGTLTDAFVKVQVDPIEVPDRPANPGYALDTGMEMPCAPEE
jgi:outer membrane protein